MSTTSHKLQPMDVAFMNPFKGYYSHKIESVNRIPSRRTAIAINGLQNVFEEYEFTVTDSTRSEKRRSSEVSRFATSNSATCPASQQVNLLL